MHAVQRRDGPVRSRTSSLTVGKVLSVATRKSVDRLISMTPGPWEAKFGLPDRAWPPAVMRRLADRAAS